MRQKNYLTLTYSSRTLSLTDADLFGGVDYIKNINPDEDIGVGYACSASIKFETSNSTIQKGDCFTYFIGVDLAQRNYGMFYVDTIEKKSDHYIITAYDGISKFDTNVDDWVSSLQYPITLTGMFVSLCNYLDLDNDPVIINGNYSFPAAPFKGYNISGRTVLQYMAGVAGGYAEVDGGLVRISTFTDKTATVNLTNANMTYCEISDKAVPQITGVRAGMTTDDVGRSVGTTDSQLAIIGNPLLTADNITQSVLPNILNAVKHSYYPATFRTLNPEHTTSGVKYKTGDIIKVNNKPVIIFEMHITKQGVVYTSTGNLERGEGIDIVTKVESLQGQTAVFKTDINGIHSEVTNLDGRTSLLEQDVGGITIEIAEVAETADEAKETAETADTKATQAKATADGLVVTVSSHTTAIDGLDTRVEDAETTIEQHADEIALRATKTELKDVSGRVEDAEAAIEVQAGQIALKANQTTVDGINGRLSTAESSLAVLPGQIESKVSKNGVVSSINQSPESVTINANKVNLSGYVTFTNLSTAGQTTINGGNITTGTIDASKATITNINASNITTGTLDASQATITNLNASNITTGSLSANYISGGTLDADNINVTNINGQNIKDNTIVTAKLQNGSITDAKIDSVSASKISAGTIDSDEVKIKNGLDLIYDLTGKHGYVWLESDDEGTNAVAKFTKTAPGQQETYLNIAANRITADDKVLADDVDFNGLTGNHATAKTWLGYLESKVDDSYICNITVNSVPSDTAFGDTSTLTFTSYNWQTPQQFYITAATGYTIDGIYRNSTTSANIQFIAYRVNTTTYRCTVNLYNAPSAGEVYTLNARAETTAVGPCIIEGTKILMADGTEKNVEDIEAGDIITSWDLTNSCTTPAVILKNGCTGLDADYDALIFDDGNYIEFFGYHSIYSATDGRLKYYKHLNTGDKVQYTDSQHELIARQTVGHDDKQRHYMLISSNNYYFANGILLGHFPNTKWQALKHYDMPQELKDLIEDHTKHGVVDKVDMRILPELAEALKDEYQADREKAELVQKLNESDYNVIKPIETFITAFKNVRSLTDILSLPSKITLEDGKIAERISWRQRIQQVEDKHGIAHAEAERIRNLHKRTQDMSIAEAHILANKECNEHYQDFVNWRTPQ